MIMLALEWLGTMLQIFGAIGLAARLCSPREAYWTMLPGAALWLGIALWTANYPLAAMQATFSVINAVGIARWRG
jgi:hypothetical protein